MSTPSDHALELIRLRAEGLASEAEQRELESLLRDDAALREVFVDYLLLDAALMSRGREGAGAQVVEDAGVARKVLPMPVAKPSRMTVSRTLRQPWMLAMAASVVFAALVGSLMFFASGTASAAAVVERALKVHAALLDRCYRVEVGGTSPPRRESLVWTRGDRFWIQNQMGAKSAAWGRDEEGRVWFTVSPEVGAWFDVDEVPERLMETCDLRSLQVESLLRSLLADFNLRQEPSATGGQMIHAELKAGHEHPRYRAALLEIDAESGVLRRAEVQRVLRGRDTVPVAFTLVETGLHEEASYTLAGHLSKTGVIYDRHSSRGARGRVLADFLTFLRGTSPN